MRCVKCSTLSFETPPGMCKVKDGPAGPQSERPVQSKRDEGDSLIVTIPKSNEVEANHGGGEEEVHVHEAGIPPFPTSCQNPSSTDLPARKKHDAVPPCLLNADLLAQIIGTETIADVIIDDAEACAFLDSGAMADMMTYAYAKARHFDIRLITELSDCFVRLNLAARFRTSVVSYVAYNLQIQVISSYDSDWSNAPSIIKTA